MSEYLGKNASQEIPWDMLSAQAFITSVQTTTGYGDIVPVTFGGKLFTLFYSFIGIPVFMWYVVQTKLEIRISLVSSKSILMSSVILFIKWICVKTLFWSTGN